MVKGKGATKPKLVKADALNGYREVVSALGGDARQMLAAARLPAAILDDSDMLVPDAAIVLLLERSASTLQCPDFGLRMAAFQGIEVLGPLAIEMGNSATVGDAFASVNKYLAAVRPGLQVTTAAGTRPGTQFLRVELTVSRPGGTEQLLELTMGVAHRILAVLSDGRLKALEVCFDHERISPASTYRAIFGSTVRFRCTQSGFLYRAADLALPIPNRDPLVQKIAHAYLEAHFAASDLDVTAQVRAVVPTLLAAGMCHHARVARMLMLHPRTMQRRLREEGTTFAAIVDEVRSELARRHLSQRGVPLGRIAELLGYTEQSAFSRGCRRWFGAAPLELRRAMVAMRSNGGSASQSNKRVR
jgi:AraC-like DNA-binding protein